MISPSCVFSEVVTLIYCDKFNVKNWIFSPAIFKKSGNFETYLLVLKLLLALPQHPSMELVWILMPSLSLTKPSLCFIYGDKLFYRIYRCSTKMVTKIVGNEIIRIFLKNLKIFVLRIKFGYLPPSVIFLKNYTRLITTWQDMKYIYIYILYIIYKYLGAGKAASTRLLSISKKLKSLILCQEVAFGRI